MIETAFEEMERCCKFMNLSITAEELAQLCEALNMSDRETGNLKEVFKALERKKNEAIINTCLKLSRLPLKEPKTFETFDFSRLHGKDVEKLKSLSSLSPLYEKKNIAFIGPQGIGKTHLSMAFGRACCEAGIKTYFIKATELDQKITAARRNDRLSRLVNGLIKSSCLIIDEIGRCTFDTENTRIFFDIVDRRVNKDGPNCMIFTSNKSPGTWEKYFNESDSLLCALDRIFDEALVFMMKGESYRGRKLEMFAIETQSTSRFLKNTK